MEEAYSAGRRLEARKRRREDEDDPSQERRRRAIGSFPYSQDCESYVQTGQCRYGRSCRFNHPKDTRHIDGRVPMRSGYDRSESGRMYDRRYENVSRSWEENREKLQLEQRRLRDLEMPRRNYEPVSRFLQHKNRETNPHWRLDERQSLRDVEMPRRNYESESRFLQHNNRDTTLDERQRQSLRDAEMARRVHETESRNLRHKYTDRTTNRRVSENDGRFDERRHERGPSPSKYSYMERYGLDPMSPDVPGLPMRQARNTAWRASDSNRRFDERTHDTGPSSSNYSHRPMERYGAEPMSFNARGPPMRQDITTERRESDYDGRFGERTHEPGLSSYNSMEINRAEPMLYDPRGLPKRQGITTDRRAGEYDRRFDERRASYAPMERHSDQDTVPIFYEAGPSTYAPMERKSEDSMDQPTSLDPRAYFTGLSRP